MVDANTDINKKITDVKVFENPEKILYDVSLGWIKAGEASISYQKKETSLKREDSFFE